MAAADHGEAVGVMKVGGAGQRRHGLLAGIDQLGVAFAADGRGAHAEHAILGVEDHVRPAGTNFATSSRDADAEIHVGAVGNVDGARRSAISLAGQDFARRGGCVMGSLLTPSFDEFRFVRPGWRLSTMRSTKIAGRDDRLGIERAELDDLARPARS